MPVAISVPLSDVNSNGNGNQDNNWSGNGSNGNGNSNDLGSTLRFPGKSGKPVQDSSWNSPNDNNKHQDDRGGNDNGVYTQNMGMSRRATGAKVVTGLPSKAI